MSSAVAELVRKIAKVRHPQYCRGFHWILTTRALVTSMGRARPGVILVVHDLLEHGAQLNALSLARVLGRRMGVRVATLSVGGDGPLARRFRATGSLKILNRLTPGARVRRVLVSLLARGFDRAIVNSAASGWIAPHLAEHGIKHIGLIHELPGVIEQKALSSDLRALNDHAVAMVYPAGPVASRTTSAFKLNHPRVIIQPQGVYRRITLVDIGQKDAARRKICKKLGASADTRIVLAVGYGDARKGVDVFIEWALATLRERTDVHFVWVGKVASEMERFIDTRLSQAGQHAHRIHFTGFLGDPTDYYMAASVYALTSREDPFPSTVLEALAAGTPVLLCLGTGGAETLSEHDCIIPLPDRKPETFTSSLHALLDDPGETARRGLIGRDVVRRQFGFSTYSGSLADMLELDVPQISAVVPNYNCRGFLEKRLRSIIDQTVPPREILFLDDASTDDSVAIAERILSESDINWAIFRNPENSGSVFSQWRKGANIATSRLLWIAEADDIANPRFLEEASHAFRQSGVVLSYTQSKQIDRRGRIISDHYLEYVKDIDPAKWRSSFSANGLKEVCSALAVKNTIPNASAVLFDRATLQRAITEHEAEISSYRVAADWCVYVNVLRYGDIAYNAAPLNLHRRHAGSVTIARFGLPELAEIARMQNYIAREFRPPPAQLVHARNYLHYLVRQFDFQAQFSTSQIEAALRGTPPA